MTTLHALPRPVPEQGAPAASSSGLHAAADRLARQLSAIDTWSAGRREREHRLRDRPLTRDQRMDVDRQIDVLRRVHDTIKGRCAAGLAADLDPFLTRTTAVVAHRHPWFRDRLVGLLADRGVTVLAATADGAEALGATVAEQPDLLLAGENLSMMTGAALLAEARRFASATVRVLQADDRTVGEHVGAADGVLPTRHSPGVVADALLGLYLSRTAPPTA